MASVVAESRPPESSTTARGGLDRKAVLIAKPWLKKSGDQGRELAIKQYRITEIELYQTAQVRHAVDIDRPAKKAGLASFNMRDPGVHADEIA
ncbi:hypothetical protein PROAA_2030002 [Candidatus Propionivibrio aalborgensis]|uniref:Uncharacterized protein n=1 Tax=Candidatus Propionivibrio aalborgensis TaxID=1860101 RepID=A0A1A8XP95_9RHOO|nr:hypothetical protein PROAA_2030002 [Candidatus Propionivibrio aalborgensis]